MVNVLRICEHSTRWRHRCHNDDSLYEAGQVGPLERRDSLPAIVGHVSLGWLLKYLVSEPQLG